MIKITLPMGQLKEFALVATPYGGYKALRVCRNVISAS
jgi:hypothetical protein